MLDNHSTTDLYVSVARLIFSISNTRTNGHLHVHKRNLNRARTFLVKINLKFIVSTMGLTIKLLEDNIREALDDSGCSNNL